MGCVVWFPSVVRELNTHVGVFAAEHIPEMSFVGVYAGEYLSDAEGEARGS